MRDAKSMVMLSVARSPTDPLEMVEDLENTVSHIEQGLHRPKEDINVRWFSQDTHCMQSVHNICVVDTLGTRNVLLLSYNYGYLILCV